MWFTNEDDDDDEKNEMKKKDKFFLFEWKKSTEWKALALAQHFDRKKRASSVCVDSQQSICCITRVRLNEFCPKMKIYIGETATMLPHRSNKNSTREREKMSRSDCIRVRFGVVVTKYVYISVCAPSDKLEKLCTMRDWSIEMDRWRSCMRTYPIHPYTHTCCY